MSFEGIINGVENRYDAHPAFIEFDKIDVATLIMIRLWQIILAVAVDSYVCTDIYLAQNARR